ncbi:MAG: DUF1847 domain-containing protein [Desulfobulbales bacterium]
MKCGNADNNRETAVIREVPTAPPASLIMPPMSCRNLSEKMRTRHGNSKIRLEEIIGSARRAGLDITGSKSPSALVLLLKRPFFSSILVKHFETELVCRKVTGLNQDEHGVAKVGPDRFEIACNSIAQAKMLNRARTVRKPFGSGPWQFLEK